MASKKTNKILRLIPNSLTLLNLLCGFLSIIFIFKEEKYIVIILIFAGFIFDSLDGALARKFNVTSKIGVELDSLADAFSFVCAPALITYFWLFNESTLGLIASSLIMVFGIYRLANFNVIESKPYFIGLATPIFTIIILSFLILDLEKIITNQPLLFILITVLGYLMISKIKYPGFKNKELAKYKFFALAILTITIVLFLTQRIINFNLYWIIVIEYLLAIILIIIPLFTKKIVKQKKYFILYLFGYLLLIIIYFKNPLLIIFLPINYGMITSFLLQKAID
jgi:CDP-diacylglycerol---serine O-phosphatidyltransferase